MKEKLEMAGVSAIGLLGDISFETVQKWSTFVLGEITGFVSLCYVVLKLYNEYRKVRDKIKTP